MNNNFKKTYRNDIELHFDLDIKASNQNGLVIIGNTKELDADDKKRSFQLYRNNIRNVMIITYDELLKRAEFILNRNEE